MEVAKRRIHGSIDDIGALMEGGIICKQSYWILCNQNIKVSKKGKKMGEWKFQLFWIDGHHIEKAETISPFTKIDDQMGFTRMSKLFCGFIYLEPSFGFF